MNKTKIAALVGLLVLIGAFTESHFDLLKSAGLSIQLINQIKLAGLALSVLLPGVATLFSGKTEK